MWQILLAHPNYETGGARQSAVAAQPMHVWRVCQLKSGFKYPDHSNNCTFSPVRAILKPQEASKVKFACFKGIVHPTHIQKQVGWGTWLMSARLRASMIGPPIKQKKTLFISTSKWKSTWNVKENLSNVVLSSFSLKRTVDPRTHHQIILRKVIRSM